MRMVWLRNLRDLYNLHKAAVFGYAYRLSGSVAEAEELTQETFYQAVLSIPRFRGDSSVLTWLLGITRNVYLKRARAAGRVEPVAPDDRRFAVADGSAGPEGRLIAKEERVELARAFALLPEQYRTALSLHELGGLSHRQIAQVLRKNEATVRMLVHWARQRLRQLYLREEGQE